MRERYDGYRRNPWDEVECGHHYARSMASWALLPALSGFSCDVDRKVLRFAPAVAADHFRTLFICGSGWGIYTQSMDDEHTMRPRVTVLGGNLDGFAIEEGRGRLSIRLDAGQEQLPSPASSAPAHPAANAARNEQPTPCAGS